MTKEIIERLDEMENNNERAWFETEEAAYGKRNDEYMKCIGTAFLGNEIFVYNKKCELVKTFK